MVVVWVPGLLKPDIRIRLRKARNWILLSEGSHPDHAMVVSVPGSWYGRLITRITESWLSGCGFENLEIGSCYQKSLIRIMIWSSEFPDYRNLISGSDVLFGQTMLLCVSCCPCTAIHTGLWFEFSQNKICTVFWVKQYVWRNLTHCNSAVCTCL